MLSNDGSRTAEVRQRFCRLQCLLFQPTAEMGRPHVVHASVQNNADRNNRENFDLLGIVASIRSNADGAHRTNFDL